MKSRQHRISLPKQNGYLTLVTVVMIVIIGFIAATLAYIIFGSSFGTINLQQASAALFLAESGFEQSTRQLLTPTISSRIACGGLSISNNLGAGSYAVTSTGPFYSSAPTTLSSAINATATTIPVTSTAAYPSSGRIMIDRELINYTGTNSTNFIGVSRGADGTLASSHAAATRIGQYQCNLSSQGGIPSLSPPSISLGGKRSLSEAIQLEEGWVAGNTVSSNWNAAHWNTPTEKQWTLQSIAVGSPQHLTAVSIVSNADAWMVGNRGVALRYNGSTWTQVNAGLPGADDVTSVSAVSSQEAWACTDKGRIYKWTPAANWTTSANPGDVPKSISMVDTSGAGTATTGWLVGTKKTAFRYNGTTWASANTGINGDLNGVSTLSATDAWAVSKDDIFKWNGTNWSSILPSSATLNSISMIQSGGLDIGWAVGASSTALYYDGTSWTLKNTGISSGLTLNSVVTVSSTEAWTVSSSGVIYEWNGSRWTVISTGSSALNGIDMIRPKTKPFSAWTENF